MPVFTCSLHTPEANLEDIQVWTLAPTSGLDHCRGLRYVCHVDQTKVPLFLLSDGPYQVYTDSSATENYFGQNLAQFTKNTGLLARGDHEHVYMVFYSDDTMTIKCFVVDFGVLDQIHTAQPSNNEDENLYYPVTARAISSRPDTTVFDRVLENKGMKKPLLAIPSRPPSMPTLVLTSSHQISQAVNKMILSGLRIRGLSATSARSANEKVAVREICQMTRKAALFSLRKFNYEFNGSKGESIRMEDIQDVVERLLEAFVDVSPSRETLRLS